MKLWDYVVYEPEGRTGLITLDMDDLKRVAFLRPSPAGQLSEATIRADDAMRGVRRWRERCESGCRARATHGPRSGCTRPVGR